MGRRVMLNKKVYNYITARSSPHFMLRKPALQAVAIRIAPPAMNRGVQICGHVFRKSDRSTCIPCKVHQIKKGCLHKLDHCEIY